MFLFIFIIIAVRSKVIGQLWINVGYLSMGYRPSNDFEHAVYKTQILNLHIYIFNYLNAISLFINVTIRIDVIILIFIS